MTDAQNLIQEKLVDREDNNDPEYKRLMAAYTDNPFFDITKESIIEYSKKKETEQPEL